MGFEYPESSFILGFLKQVLMTRDVDKLNGFVTSLQDELLRVQVFHRELPLCVLLLNDALRVLKQETSHLMTSNAYEPVLEEFIPLNKECGVNTEINKADSEREKQDCESDKKNWMSSVQLWNAHGTDNQIPKDTLEPMEDAKGSKVLGGHDQGLCKHKTSVNKEEANDTVLSLVAKQHSIPRVLNPKIGGIEVVSSSPSSNGRKHRRCWSAELHRRFVDALTQLGGPQVATPKQIRELMEVDGLTNDEVKSHLQKYRLHAQRVLDKSGSATKDEYSESSKTSSFQSRSPDGPLLFDHNEYDEKFASYCWKGYVQKPGTNHL